MNFYIRFKQAVVRAITCDYLAEALREHTKALREHSAALLTKTSTCDSDHSSHHQAANLAKIAEHIEFLATSELRRLQKACPGCVTGQASHTCK
jgi:hypothetical protein